jgi:hypothetical protein
MLTLGSETSAVDRHLKLLSRLLQLLARAITTGVHQRHAAEQGEHGACHQQLL